MHQIIPTPGNTIFSEFLWFWVFEDLTSQGVIPRNPLHFTCHSDYGHATRTSFPSMPRDAATERPREPGPEWAEETAQVERPRMLMGPGPRGLKNHLFISSRWPFHLREVGAELNHEVWEWLKKSWGATGSHAAADVLPHGQVNFTSRDWSGPRYPFWNAGCWRADHLGMKPAW